MSSGFRLLHAGGYTRDLGLWEVAGVRYEADESWCLRVEMERSEEKVHLSFEEPVSFRVQDEMDLVECWIERAHEQVGIGTLYEIGSSDYLRLLQSSTSGRSWSLKHFLVAGQNICVEVISDAPPKLPTAWTNG